jgi:hypothetical protein
MCLLQCLNGHIRVICPTTSHQSVCSWPPALPRSAPDAHWSHLEARYLRYIRITSTAVIQPLTCEERRVGGCVMCWCYCGREYGRCGCYRVHHRPPPRPLSTPTTSHNRSSVPTSKPAISSPPLLPPSHALHELSTMPSPPPPTLPPADRWVIGPQGRPVAPSTRTGLLLKRSISHVPASHQPSVKYPLTREKEEGRGRVMRSCSH